jgi:hypothetical protein
LHNANVSTSCDAQLGNDDGQVHNLRNVLDHLPDSRRAYVRPQMRDAYRPRTDLTLRSATPFDSGAVLLTYDRV